jgi:hypothetical protein
MIPCARAVVLTQRHASIPVRFQRTFVSQGRLKAIGETVNPKLQIIKKHFWIWFWPVAGTTLAVIVARRRLADVGGSPADAITQAAAACSAEQTAKEVKSLFYSCSAVCIS